MKKVFIVISILLSVSVISFSCGGSSINCTKDCDKQKECLSSTDVASCKTTCSKLNDTLNEDVLSKWNGCTNQACESIASCRIDAFQNCNTSLGGLFGKICAQLQSCGGFVDTQTCVNSLKDAEGTGAFNLVKCLDSGFLNSLASCASSTGCDIPSVLDCILERTQFLRD